MSSKEKQNKEEKLKEKVEYTLQNIYGYGRFGKSDVIDINKLVYTFNTNKEFLKMIKGDIKSSESIFELEEKIDEISPETFSKYWEIVKNIEK